MSDALVDPAELALYQSGDSALLLAHAEGLVRGYCGWHIAPSRDETLVADGTGTRDVWLPTLCLTDVYFVADNGQALDLADIDWWRFGRLHRYDDASSSSCYWTPRKRTVEAEVTHGYDETPADVRAVVCSVASRTIASPSGGGVRSESAGAVSITYASNGTPSGFLPDELRVLDRYRIYNRP